MPENTRERPILFVCEQIFRCNEVETGTALVVHVKQPQLTSLILKKLSHPTALAHLRRVNKGAVLAGLSKTLVEEEKLRSQVGNALEIFADQFELKTLQVPLVVPKTKQQYDFCQTLWPVRFKENIELESKLAGTHFLPQQVNKILIKMAEATETDGCLITDSQFTTLARAVDSQWKREAPLKHPFMRAFDSLAQSNRERSKKRSVTGDHYLATDCFVFVDQEPCAMCAMGMVHGRVGKVFFRHLSSQGAFLSSCQLHLKPQLNHHYEVYQVKDD